MEIREHVSLKDEHTFHLPVAARFFVEIHSREELTELLTHPVYQENKSMVIGDGSNILFASDFDGLVIKIDIKGKNIISEDDQSVVLEVGAGEEWADIVTFAAGNGWGGIENLAFIPGTVGAAPIQNIGAYGQNFEDVFMSLDAVRVRDGLLETFDKNRCHFGYRTSFFKEEGRGNYIVTAVRIALSKKPALELSYTSRYESLMGELHTFAKEPFTPADVVQAITNIRSRKLPDPAKVGNAGSFFKNPIVSKSKVIELQKELPGLPFYPANEWSSGARDIAAEPDDARFKIPAAWLLEDMGWKGNRVGNCGTWPTQPLSIVNYGGATAAELLAFVESVRQAVEKRYGVVLENEVEIIR